MGREKARHGAAQIQATPIVTCADGGTLGPLSRVVGTTRSDARLRESPVIPTGARGTMHGTGQDRLDMGRWMVQAQGSSTRGPRAGSRRLVAVVGILAAILTPSLAGAPVAFASAPAMVDTSASALALAGSDFVPGLIISDTLFYNGAAMTSDQIQAFLDQRVGTCTNGQCLNVGVVNFPGRAKYVSSNTGAVVCDAIAAGTIKVSELIYRTQVACGISAQVILVTLQKEQGLITDRGPSATALSHAMGMACPDTAPCDPGYAGLATQIVTGTAQLKCYMACKFAKQPGVQAIQYSPNAACGSTSVLVQNYATAALYSYTPYQPNAAALANLNGTGDGCSSYGNRNFWVYYSSWFGNPLGSGEGTGAVAIDQAWAASGGKTGPWGNRVLFSNCLSGVDCAHVFENTIVGWTPDRGLFQATGAMMQFVLQQGLAVTGSPDSNQVAVTQNGGGIAQSFSRALVDWGPPGPFLVSGLTRAEHALLGGVGGSAGWPTSVKTCSYSGGACLQNFQNADISEVGGIAFSLTDPAVRTYFKSYGVNGGTLGLPNTDLIAVNGPNGSGKQQSFQFGLVASSASGTFALKGIIRTVHGAAGGVNASLGWPTSEQICNSSGACSQSFQHGIIYAANATTTRIISNASIAAYYQSKGGLAGMLGAPLTDVVPVSVSGGGAQVAFAGGLVETSAAGTFNVTGAIRTAHGAAGGVGGPLGWPTAEQTCGLPKSGCSQAFQHGTIYQTAAGGAQAVTSPAIATLYASLGGPGGSLGYPVTVTVPVTQNGGGVAQAFENGLVNAGPAGAFVETGSIRDQHAKLGGVGGSIGWPTAAMTCDSSGNCSQTFQRGTLSTSTATVSPPTNTSGFTLTDPTVAAAYSALGGATGPLGSPNSVSVQVAENGGGVAQSFQNGLLNIGPAGAFIETGAIRTKHGNLGGVGGPMGWPTAAMHCNLPGNGCAQEFQNGVIYVDNNGVAQAVTDPKMLAAYTSLGGPAGSLGYPNSISVPVTQNGGGVAQSFQNGLVNIGPSGPFVLTGAIRTKDGELGGVGGPVGWPTGAMHCDLPGGGCAQGFQNGTIYVDNKGVGQAVTDATMSSAYATLGGPAGSLGYPNSITVRVTANGGGVAQSFQGGLVNVGPAGAFIETGEIRDKHAKLGGVGGSLGWPTAAITCTSPGVCSQTFQHGTITGSN